MESKNWAVRNTHTDNTVGMYTESKAKALATEWNELAFGARQVTPYIVVEFSQVNNIIAGPNLSTTNFLPSCTQEI
jgi:hypothetical protein